MKHKGLVASLCMLFLCIESSFAGVALAQQAGPQSAQSHLTLNDVIGRIQNRLSPELIGKVLDQALTLQESGQLEFGKYIQTHLDQFDVDVVEDELMAYMPQNSTQLSTIASKLIGRDIDEQHLPAWSLVHSALLKLEFGVRKELNSSRVISKDALDASLSQVGSTLALKGGNEVADNLCDPNDFDAPCAKNWRAQFQVIGILSALGFAQVEMSGTYHVLGVACRYLIDGKGSAKDRAILEEAVPLLKDYADSFYLNPQTQGIIAKNMKARLVLVALVIMNALGDVMSPILMMVTTLSSAVGPWDARGWVSGLPYILNLVLLVLNAFGQLVTVIGDDQEQIGSEYGLEDKPKVRKVMVLAILVVYFLLVYGCWLTWYGTFTKQIGVGSAASRAVSRTAGLILFPLGVVGMIALSILKGRGQPRASDKDSKFNFKSLALSVIFFVLTFVGFYVPVANHDPNTEVSLFAVFLWSMLSGLSLLAGSFFLTKGLKLKKRLADMNPPTDSDAGSHPTTVDNAVDSAVDPTAEKGHPEVTSLEPKVVGGHDGDELQPHVKKGSEVVVNG